MESSEQKSSQSFREKALGAANDTYKSNSLEAHDKDIYPKVEHWFDVMGKVLVDEATLVEDAHNMYETGLDSPRSRLSIWS